MENFGLWHLTALISFAIPVATVIVVWLVVRYLRQIARATTKTAGMETSPRSAEVRLRELSSLKADGLITEKEYEQRRSVVLGEL